MTQSWKETYFELRRMQDAGEHIDWTKTDTDVPTHSRGDIYDDAYQAAICILRDDSRHGVFRRHDLRPNVALTDRYVFRGQGDASWLQVPSIFRFNPSEEQVLSHALRTTAFVRLIQSTQPGLEDELKALAAAQHYSEAAEVKTGLLDVTYDPLVALFFASLACEPGKVGRVWSNRASDIREFSGHGPYAIGTLEIVEAPGISRLSAQKGAFIDGIHPELFPQLTPWSLRFHQQAGCVFEDGTLDPPITRDHLIKENDPADKLLNLANEFKKSGNPGSQVTDERIIPVSGPITLGSVGYERIAKSWMSDPNNPAHQDTLRLLCAVHAKLVERDLGKSHHKPTSEDAAPDPFPDRRFATLRNLQRLALDLERSRGRTDYCEIANQILTYYCQPPAERRYVKSIILQTAKQMGGYELARLEDIQA